MNMERVNFEEGFYMTDATNTPETNAPEAAPVVKLTRREKLLAAYNKTRERALKDAETLKELVEEINSIDLLASTDVGATVIISVGRGEDAKDVRGTVIGVKDDEETGKTFKVQYGEGFDTDVAVVKASKIKLPPAEELIAAAEEAAQA